MVETGDLFDARVVDALLLGPDALSGHELALSVRFADQTNGVYLLDLTTIPEPGTALLLATGLIAFAATRRSRRRKRP